QVSSFSLPWADPQKIPYTIMGPYLKPLFDRAFIDGLHDPSKRPTADEWESALVKTVDLIQPCQNKDCDQKWYVFNGKTKP
ncbi:kinase, partial [Klebsiella pneumoniae]|nr:kinase [Klebsiella pneumoniae]